MIERIFLDIDGVVGNWELAAMKLVGAQNDLRLRNQLKNGADFEKIHPNLRQLVANAGVQYWENIELFPWSNELYDRLNNLGDLCFLTSSGDIKKGFEFVSNASNGKVKWLNKYFPNSKFIISRYKELAAGPNAILIDDTYKNIERFEEGGGHSFHWPDQYKMLDKDIPFEETYQKLENKILQG